MGHYFSSFMTHPVLISWMNISKNSCKLYKKSLKEYLRQA